MRKWICSFTAFKGKNKKTLLSQYGHACNAAGFSTQPQISEGVGKTPGWESEKKHQYSLGLNNMLSADGAGGIGVNAQSLKCLTVSSGTPGLGWFRLQPPDKNKYVPLHFLFRKMGVEC